MELSVGMMAVLLSILWSCIHHVHGSAGDRSRHFDWCLGETLPLICNKPDEFYAASIPFYMRWLNWNCKAESEYLCMWPTVEAFQKDGHRIPQFHGKWPFIRVLGIQEPASVVFSILNAATLLIALYRFRCNTPSTAPMYYLVHSQNLVSVNAWVWSTVFHTRDTSLTEMLDYFCAISLVIFSTFMFFCRMVGTEKWWRPAIPGVCLAAFFVKHVHYLAYVKFDYGYNIMANVTVVVISTVGWTGWALWVRKRQPYVWRCIATMVLLNLLILLEVFDFPPLWWVFDAHSLWHAGTVPLPLLWYKFISDDCNYLLKQKEEDEKTISDTKKKQ